MGDDDTNADPSSSLNALDFTDIDAESNRIELAFCGTVGVLAGIVSIVGGFFMFVWSLSLIFENWGLFYAAMAFFFFPAALVTVVMCFFWGVPYFFLAFVGWVAAAITMGLLTEEIAAKRVALVGLLAIVGFTGSAGYLGWKDAITPDPITERIRHRLEDDALSVIALLRISQDLGDDAEATIKYNRARSMLREEFSEYDSAKMDIIVAVVDQFLQYEYLLEQDLKSYLEGLLSFQKSRETEAALRKLPSIIQTQLAQVDRAIELMGEMFDGVSVEDVPPNWEDVMEFVFDQRWTEFRAIYENVLGRSMPSFR